MNCAALTPTADQSIASKTILPPIRLRRKVYSSSTREEHFVINPLNKFKTMQYNIGKDKS